jgi:Xaa-Pro aminopeptidase
MPYPPRRAAARTLLREVAPGLDALLVTDLVNVRYLTGFTGSNAALLLHVDGDDASRFCTDGRYRTQAAHEVPDLPLLVERGSARALAAAASDHRVQALGFESDQVTVDARDELAEAAAGVVLHRAPGLVQRLRTVKDEAEVAALRAACAAADAALAGLLADGGLRPGRTEREVAHDLENRMRDHGATGPAFETIVAAGPNSAVPHHRPGATVLRRGDLVTMDFGALVDGYHSDMTRTVVVGEPSPTQQRMLEVVARSQSAGVSAVAPGVACADVDRTCRDVIADAGWADAFVHGTGHGVGLQIHEDPRVSATATGTLQPGHVVTVEPGVYLPEHGGVRIEDTVVVTATGCRVLTAAPKTASL